MWLVTCVAGRSSASSTWWVVATRASRRRCPSTTASPRTATTAVRGRSKCSATRSYPGISRAAPLRWRRLAWTLWRRRKWREKCSEWQMWSPSHVAHCPVVHAFITCANRPGGRCTNSMVGHTLDNPKLRHLYWLLNRLTAIMTNKNDVI